RVERDVFVQVPWGIVRLGPEDRLDLEHALEHADHHLFKKLGALGQAGGAAEVVEAEDVGPALGRAADDLRPLDLDEALRPKGRPKAGQRGRSELEQRVMAWVLQAERGVV